MRLLAKILLIPVLPTIVVGCLKDDEYSVVPDLTFKSFKTFSANVVDIDSATFTFSFTDGDGDIGSSDTTVLNCFMDYYEADGDTMKYFPSFQRQYRLPNLTPNAKNKSIEGEISLTIKPAPIFNPATDSAYQWKCFIIDRAGNESNVVSSPVYSK